MSKLWSASDIEVLVTMYDQGEKLSVIAKALGRSENAVIKFASKTRAGNPAIMQHRDDTSTRGAKGSAATNEKHQAKIDGAVRRDWTDPAIIAADYGSLRYTDDPRAAKHTFNPRFIPMPKMEYSAGVAEYGA